VAENFGERVDEGTGVRPAARRGGVEHGVALGQQDQRVLDA
jgi:hypothetical protein